jgi:hypothetical protein
MGELVDFAAYREAKLNEEIENLQLTLDKYIRAFSPEFVPYRSESEFTPLLPISASFDSYDYEKR